ncbi:MAG: histidine kinase, partial [Bacteroidetes bacterium]|nr:histidine kinase [Bacteroidota bacterium]
NNLIRVFAFIAICIILFTIPLMDAEGKRMMWDHRTFNAWIRTAIFIMLFLVNSYVFVPKLLFKKERVLYIIVVIVSVSLLALAWELFMPLIDGGNARPQGLPPRPQPGFGPPDHNFRPPPKDHLPNRSIMLINNVLISFLVVGLSTALRVTQKWLADEKSLREMEKENLRSELAFLKNQISPHFFLNTLNNIHALIDIDKKDSQKAIIELSGMMRYLLYESEKGESSLKKEIAFIQNFIDLMKLRIDEKVGLSIELPDELPDVSIPPLLFISFIENAFKHGVSYSHPSFIKISLTQSDEFIEFLCINSNHNQKGQIEEDSGIGLSNVKKRLELLYENKHDLTITDSKDTYSIYLKIPVS